VIRKRSIFASENNDTRRSKIHSSSQLLECYVHVMGDHFRFSSVFIKKSNQTELFFKKTRNRIETSSNRPVPVRFGFLGQKPVQTGLARFFAGFSSVWFGFFGFRLIKLKLNRTGWFFQNFNRFNQFFSQFGFFSYFFQVFSVFRFFYSPLVHVPTTFLK